MRNPHQKNLRNGRVSISGQIYAITKCQNKRQNPLLTSRSGLPEMIIETFFFSHHKKWMHLYAFVIMPDHYHLLLGLEDLKSLDEVLQSINSFSSLRATKEFGFLAPVWQENYFDHAVRSDESLETQMNYIEENPLRAGLVEKSELWEYSSANQRYAKLLNRLYL